MNEVFINITDEVDKIPHIEDLLPKEYQYADKLKSEGILTHLFVKADKSGAYLVMKNVDIDKAKELLRGFPMYPYYQKVEYSYVEDVF